MTEDEFDDLAATHREAEIREMFEDLQALREQRAAESDAVKAALLDEEVDSWTIMMISRMRDIGRDDDDLINDSVFHAQ